MIGRIITRGRNSGLKCLSTGSLPPFPFPFLAIFPQTESLFTGYGGGGNETNGKKAIGLVKQNNNFARASRFFE